MGLDLRTDFQGQGAFNLRLSHNRHWLNEGGAEWRNRVQVGETLGVYSELYQPLTLKSDRFVSGYVDATLRRVGNSTTTWGRSVALVRRQGIQVGLDLGWPMGLLGNVGDMRVGLVAGHRKVTPDLVAGVEPEDLVGTLSWNEVGVRGAVIADQLDYANFPSNGYRAKGEVVLGRRTYYGVASGSDSFTRLEGTATGVEELGGAHAQRRARDWRMPAQIPLGAVDEYALGGFQQLSGYRVGQVAGNYLVFGRVTYYQRLPYSTGVARALFVGGSLEAGNAWTNRSDIALRGMRAGSSLFVGRGHRHRAALPQHRQRAPRLHGALSVPWPAVEEARAPLIPCNRQPGAWSPASRQPRSRAVRTGRRSRCGITWPRACASSQPPPVAASSAEPAWK